jgi:hypothetical protein
MFMHGKRINGILYVKTHGGNWIELRILTGMTESINEWVPSNDPRMHLFSGADTHTLSHIHDHHNQGF